MQESNPTAVKVGGKVVHFGCEVGVCVSTIQQGLGGCLHVTLALLERLYDEEARVEEAVDAVGLQAGGPGRSVSGSR